jgi:hypothetical protein
MYNIQLRIDCVSFVFGWFSALGYTNIYVEVIFMHMRS